ncbi:MAG: aminotransferase class V-fold PLP-dependent enzyme [Saprospiraceae bacterium]
MQSQKHLFNLPHPDVTYLNGAYMSPQLKSVEAIGHEMVSAKCQPYSVSIDDFFEPRKRLQRAFAKLINADDYERIALIPAVSYGVATVAKNIQLSANQKVIVADEQFPSNIYTWKRLTDETGATLQLISAPTKTDRAENWTNAIIEAIDESTAVVTMGTVHWADGTKYDLEAIGKRAREVGAYFILDGTQSVGALPFDIQKVGADALICGGYKWLLGPYSQGVAYYSERFDNGVPIEENWINRYRSEDFKNLVNYEDRYQPKAARYSVGEQSNFILVPMLTRAIEQLLEWGTDNIQDYTQKIAAAALPQLQALGCQIEAADQRAHHLFGVRLPADFPAERLQEILKERQIWVSFRGDSIRIAPHVYNDAGDFGKLVACFVDAKNEVLSS